MTTRNKTQIVLTVILIYLSGVHAQTVINFSINTNTGKGNISPLIYGTNVLHNFPVTAVNNYYPDIPSRRFGGDRVTGYNWENNFSNGGSYVCDPAHPNDRNYCNPNDDALPFFHQLPVGDYLKAGAVLKNFHDLSVSNHSYSLIQLPMAGYVARDGNGNVSIAESAPSNRWVKVINKKGTPFSLSPDQNDANMYVDEEMNFLIQTYGNASTANGVKGYELDNEPDIWYADGEQQGKETGTHPRLFPQPLRVDEFMAKTLDLVKTIKRMDPNADVLGPVFANYSGYYNLHNAPDWGNYAAMYPRFVEAYLAKMKEYSIAEGKRLLNVFTLHWYSQEDGIDGDDISADVVRRRLQAPRSLWDNTYVENSWITQFVTNMQAIQQIPDLQKAIDNNYPDTKIGFTEWRFGARNHISGGITTADALGIFGKYDVYLATFYDNLEGFVKAAFMLYRNYDGNGEKFGNKKIFSSTDDIEKTSVYASMNDNESEMHLIVLNKTEEIIEGHFSINSNQKFKPEVKVFGIVADDPTVKSMGSTNVVSMNQFIYNVPPLSALHLVLTPTGTTNVANRFSSEKYFSMDQNYPNPFAHSTKISYAIDQNSFTTLKVYDVLGREAATLVNNHLDAGNYSTEFHPNNLPAGMYYYILQSGKHLETKRMSLMK